MITRISTYSSPSFFGPTPSINDHVQSFSDGSYERHTDPLQYNTFGNHHRYSITIPPNYLLRYIPRRLVWWVAVHNTPTINIHVITIIFVVILAIQVIGSYRYDPQRLGTIPKSIFPRLIEKTGLDASQFPPISSRERAVILNRRY